MLSLNRGVLLGAYDHSVEIYEKSPDMNLVISYDENLEINRYRPQMRSPSHP